MQSARRGRASVASVVFLVTTFGWTLACAGGEDTDKPGLFEDKDVDGDGFLYDEDCNDDDASINPDAPERCDATDIDEDCDGRADNADDDAVDGIEAHRDADADGYGSANTVILCEIVAGYTADASDCNDDDPAVNPLGQEVCGGTGGADEDCDGLVDDADDSVSPEAFIDLWEDRDGDGYGGDAAPAACAPTATQVENGEDCDDGDAATNPAGYEVCGGADEDCDGTVDEDDATDAPTWYADMDGDTFGDASEALISCDAPPRHVADDTDCDDTDGSAFPGAPESCDDVDDDCDGDVDENAVDEPRWYGDDDGDGYGELSDRTQACDRPAGYVASSTDCDDTDASVSPGASERCDPADVDEDCDGDADDFDASTTAAGRSFYYPDDDGDGFGDGTVPYYLCDSHPGYITDDTDCDDTSATVNPSGTEVCDARDVDEDCNGVADNDDAGVAASSTTTSYRDADADAYGDAASSVTRCEVPTGYVTVSTDCDDTNASRSPARAEVCDAANVDEDCDLLADDADSSVGSSGKTTWYADLDGDAYGDAASTVSRCDQPAEYVTDATDCDVTDVDVNPGAEEVCFDTVDDDCDGVTRCERTTSVAHRTLVGSTTYQSMAGTAVAAVDDLDGDGIEDLLIGAWHDNEVGGAGGKAYVALGGGSGAGELETMAETTWQAEGSYRYAGKAVAGVGDLDGDGVPDLAIGASADGEAGTSAGAVFFVSGAVTGATTLSSASAWAKVTGESVSQQAGTHLSNVGDVDGDGRDDVLVGENLSPWEPGTTTLLTDLVAGTSSLSAATAHLEGETVQDYSTRGVGADVDGDGYSDLIIGAYGDDDGGSGAGAAYLVLGPVTGTLALASADAKLTGESARDGAGEALSSGDINGDGYADVVVAGEDARGYGAAYLVLGPGISSGSLSTADAIMYGAVVGGIFGTAVAANGDLDGDGYDDVTVSDPAGLGAISVFLGPLSGLLSSDDSDVEIVGETVSAGLGCTLTYVDSQVGTPGVSDLVVGAATSSLDPGYVYVFSASEL